MPELAEVEFYRKRWDCGVGYRIVRITFHEGKRIFRGIDTKLLSQLLPGSMLLGSEARGKQMLFRFSRNVRLGVHLGMTGSLRAEALSFEPGKHDHLVLYQKERALVFKDVRLFGRLLFHHGPAVPEWWAKLPPALDSAEFTPAVLQQFLDRHRKLPMKATLLLQSGFPGVGNWMADEILWRAGVAPRAHTGALGGEQVKRLWKMVRSVCRGAMKHVSEDHSDPPKGWLVNERWQRGGTCPKHRTPLTRETIGGRTTVWCPKCQPD